MRFTSSIVQDGQVSRAMGKLLTQAEADFTAGMADLAMLFVTGHFNDELPEVLQRVASTFPSAVILGCSAEGTIGVDREIERVPSMSLLVGSLPGVAIRPFHVCQPALERAAHADDWERIVGASPESQPVFVAIADPFSIAIYDLLDRLNQTYPGAPVVGGVASAAREPMQNALLLNGEIHRAGLIGVALTGQLVVNTVVSQGCKPIGKPFVITRGEGNVIRELGGRPPLEQLQSVIEELSEEDEQLARQSLFVGRVIDEYKSSFSRGDFLIHNIIGVDRKSGSLGIAATVRVGATVQFHVRDAKSADEDLRAMLAPFRGEDVRGAMLFGCNGRGTHMWPQPGHDVGVLRECLGDVPVAGFFCAGEFGPIGGKNFVHGFTASIALLSDPEGDAA